MQTMRGLQRLYDEAIQSIQILSFCELENGATDCLPQNENYSPPSPGQDQISASVAAAQIQSISVSFLF